MCLKLVQSSSEYRADAVSGVLNRRFYGNREQKKCPWPAYGVVAAMGMEQAVHNGWDYVDVILGTWRG